MSDDSRPHAAGETRSESSSEPHLRSDGSGDTYDLLVVGGGVNGAGIARDAAGRRLRVLLCEQHDLAAHTSSSSTKLVHGGLRYLEFYDFALVRKSLLERERLIAAAPHIVRPLRFVLPHDRHLRPAWMIRAGLVLYDHLARRRMLPGSERVDLRTHPAGASLEERYATGFVYSDAWVDDARLVVLTALDARERGAAVLTRTRCDAIRRDGAEWVAQLTATSNSGRTDGSRLTVRARAVVNATGPWVAQFLDAASPVPAGHHPRMIKGSHVVVRRLYDHEYAYLFQAPDGRVIFTIPFAGEFTLIGTTERDYAGDLATPEIDAAEVDYLLEMTNRYFARDLTRDAVVWSFAGLRPLLAASTEDPKSITRDYVLELDRHGPPLLSVYGGKITTYRRLAEDVVDELAPLLGCRSDPWTANAKLPGGDLSSADLRGGSLSSADRPAGDPRAGVLPGDGAPDTDFDGFLSSLGRRYPWLPAALRDRYARAYGSRVARLIGDASGLAGLGAEVLPGLHAAEIDYLRREEWAVTAEDILWRRSKLGLHLPRDAGAALDAWLAAHPVVGAVAARS